MKLRDLKRKNLLPAHATLFNEETSYKILITGAAGFIGFHLAKRLLTNNHHIVGFDNLNSYYDVNLKEARLNELYKISETKNKCDETWFCLSKSKFSKGY